MDYHDLHITEEIRRAMVYYGKPITVENIRLRVHYDRMERYAPKKLQAVSTFARRIRKMNDEIELVYINNVPHRQFIKQGKAHDIYVRLTRVLKWSTYQMKRMASQSILIMRWLEAKRKAIAKRRQHSER